LQEEAAQDTFDYVLEYMQSIGKALPNKPKEIPQEVKSLEPIPESEPIKEEPIKDEIPMNETKPIPTDDMFNKKEGNPAYSNLIDSIKERLALIDKNSELLNKVNMWPVEKHDEYKAIEADLKIDGLVIKKGSKTIGKILHRESSAYIVDFGGNKITCWYNELFPIVKK